MNKSEFTPIVAGLVYMIHDDQIMFRYQYLCMFQLKLRSLFSVLLLSI